MKKALLRLEDVGPGGYYESEESLWKLRVIADFLSAADVPFHVAMIPRFINPKTGYDRSIADRCDPHVRSFLATLDYLHKRGGSIGLHGYSHQHGESVSGDGFEFAYAECTTDCAPDDPKAAFLERGAFESSYASARMRNGFLAAFSSGLSIDWFETPHYTASENQRRVIEGWTGLIFENDPHSEETRKIVVDDADLPLFRGTIYVPTPLYYLDGAHPEQDLQRMCEQSRSFQDGEIAGFFYHPYLEFPFIRREGSRVVYEEHSYLKRLVRCFQAERFRFVSLLSQVSFVPTMRQTDFFPGQEIWVGDIDGDRQSELIVRERETGDWYAASASLELFPCRRSAPLEPRRVLRGVGGGEVLIGDVNGDGRDDLVLWDRASGAWRVALSDGESFQAPSVWLDCFGSGGMWKAFLADWNGDGRADLAVWNKVTGAWRLAESDGAKFCPLRGVASGHSDIDQQALYADLNGDGRAELLLWNPDSGSWRVGSWQAGALQMERDLWLDNWAVGKEWRVRVGDFDRDGRADVLVVDPERGDWQIARSTGERLVPDESVLRPWVAGREMEPLVGVWSPDGRSSICARNRSLRGGTVDFALSVVGKGKPGR